MCIYSQVQMAYTRPMVPYFQRVDVPGSLVERSVTHRQTDTQTDYCNLPLLRMRAEG